MAQPAWLGELAVRHLADQRRRHPMRVTRVLARDINERGGLTAQLLQLGLDVVELAVVEPGSHAADIVQAGLSRDPHEQRSDSAATTPLALSPAADHDLLHPMQLDLEPGVSSPPRLVGRITALGHDA